MPLKQWPCKLTTADVVVQRKGRRRQKKTEEDEQKEREAEARRKRIARSLPLPSKLSGSGKLDKSDFDANVSAARLQESIQRETRLTWSMSSTLAVRMLVFEKGLLERCFCDQPEVSAVARSNFFCPSGVQEMPLYFQEPKQLLDIFTSLEESNLFLIQNSQAGNDAPGISHMDLPARTQSRPWRSLIKSLQPCEKRERPHYGSPMFESKIQRQN